MPAATARKQDPFITYTDDQLTNIQKSVAGNLKQAGINTNLEAVIPVHVPGGSPKITVDEDKIQAEKSVPASFNPSAETAFSPLKVLSENLDYADQIVTGRTHVVGDADKFSRRKEEKEQKRIVHSNSPQNDSAGPIKKFVAWLHDEAA